LSSKAKAILKKYPLCPSCLKRQLGTKIKPLPRRGECFICGGFFERIDDVAKSVVAALSEYEFENFSIGLSTPSEWIEREDLIRSEFKLQGKRNVKSDASHMLASRIAEILKKPINRLKPDVLAVVDVVSGAVKVEARSIYLFGRYTKSKRGLPQKHPRCRVCGGRGCPECEYTGRAKGLSVEHLINQYLLKILQGAKTTFSWFGGEDERSLVLGAGRPFYVEVHNPKKRRLPTLTLPANLGYGIKLTQLTLLDAKPEKVPSFKIKVLARVLFQSKPDKKVLKNLPNPIEVNQASLGKRKTYVKKIYSPTIRLVGNKGYIRFICDGGLSIKRFLTGVGEPVTPNLPSLLGVNTEVDEEKPFDILDVLLEGF
jgi:tRNA pseudouridine synthase 10